MIEVSGRLYPVEIRWRPFEESRDHDLDDAIGDAVDELWRGSGGSGDVLVFLPGEREIREAAERAAQAPSARASRSCRCSRACRQQEQDRVFAPHSARRIVLATNVAETSLTVPGIRYVVDAGTARVKRYSYRNKVEQLPIEPISQAAANQRAGRCGRVADGICIRLYDEDDFAGAAEVHRPGDPALVARRRDPAHEVAATSAASRTSRSSSRRRKRAIADGYQLLAELGAVDDAERADDDRPRARAPAARSARRPHDPRGARPRGACARC